MADAEARTAERAGGGGADLGAARGRGARLLHRHGPDRRERRPVRERHPRGAGRVRRPLPAAGHRGARARLLRAGDHPRSRPSTPTATRSPSASDDGIRPGTTVEKLAELKPVFRPDGTVTAGNACPLNDGAAAVIVMSDTRARELGPHPAGPDRLVRRHRPEPRDHGPRPGRGLPPGPGARRDDHRRHRPRRDQRGLRRPGGALGASSSASPWEKLNVNGGAIALGHPFGMTGARIMTTLLNGLEDAGGDHRPRDDVRRRRPGHGHDRRAAQLTRSRHRAMS